MSDKNYQELQAELVELENALDGENNQQMRSEIDAHITEVKGLLANYDLSDDDLFKCQRCNEVSDIEESVQYEGDELYCEPCFNEVSASD